jgi:hypothetical protein
LADPPAGLRASVEIAFTTTLLEYFSLLFDSSRMTFTAFHTVQKKIFSQLHLTFVANKNILISAWFRYARSSILLLPFRIIALIFPSVFAFCVSIAGYSILK